MPAAAETDAIERSPLAVRRYRVDTHTATREPETAAVGMDPRRLDFGSNNRREP